MTLSQYADLYVEQHSTHRIIKAAVRAFASFFGERDYAHCTSEDWLLMFRSTPRASVTTLWRYRGALLSFLRWINDAGELDVSASIASLQTVDLTEVAEDTNASLLNGYFGSYDELMDAVERVFHKDGQEPLNAPILYTMMTLVWYGIPWRQALSIRKDEVLILDGLCTIQGRYRIRHERAIRYIHSYLSAVQGYDVNERVFVYKPSPMLFRTHTSPTISEESFRSRLAQLNMLVSNESVRFSFDKIHESAVFARAYVLITNMGIKVSPTPTAALIPYFPRLFELTGVEISKTSHRNEAWRLFYCWCKKFRSVSLS